MLRTGSRLAHSAYIKPRFATRRTASTVTPAPVGTYARRALYAAAFATGGAVFSVYYLDARSAIHRYLLTPVLRHVFDAETGHKIAVQVLRAGLGPHDPLPDDPVLRTEMWGKKLSSPIGLAAGFDKDGEAIDGLFNLGFSWVEVGSVTPKPQAGNPRPRVFHLTTDSALINRYGFPSLGHGPLARRLAARSQNHSGKVLAVNLGKNKTSSQDDDGDYVAGIQAFADVADVLVINVSSPNTPGLRGLQNPGALDRLMKAAIIARDASERRPKLLLKLAPDLDSVMIADIARVVANRGVDGVIVSNTTISRPLLSHPNKAEAGGLSGPPLKPLALAAVREMRKRLPASIPVIGCGGISSGADALDYARAGAAAVQVYTAFGYGGAGTARRVKDELTEQLQREGTTWAQVVQDAVRKNALQGPTPGSEIAELIADATRIDAQLERLSRDM